jgi:hypothetical protein
VLAIKHPRPRAYHQVRGVSSKAKNFPDVSSRVALSSCNRRQYELEVLFLTAYLGDHTIDRDIDRSQHIVSKSQYFLRFATVVCWNATGTLVSTRLSRITRYHDLPRMQRDSNQIRILDMNATDE